MRDTYRRHRAITQSLMQCDQSGPSGQCERHVNTLVAMIYGLTDGQRVQIWDGTGVVVPAGQEGRHRFPGAGILRESKGATA